MDSPLVRIVSLTKTYKNIAALKNVNLEIPQGRIVGLLGPNGCGKTTMIKILVGLLQQYQGEVYIDGFKPGIQTKSIVAYLPDRNILNPTMNVFECVEFFETFYADFNSIQAREIIDVLQIPTNRPVKSMSKGTIEKLHLLLTLSRRAKIYIFDEPIAGVDPLAREQIFELISRYAHTDASILLATHLIHDAQKILDDAIFLCKGEVLRYESVDRIVSTDLGLEEAFKIDLKVKISQKQQISSEYGEKL